MQPLRVPLKGGPGLTLEEMKKFVADHFKDFVNRKKPEVALVNFSADFLIFWTVTSREALRSAPKPQ